MAGLGRPRLVWHRVPGGGKVEVPTGVEGSGRAVPDSAQDRVVVQWNVRHLHSRRIVEVFLRNSQPVTFDLPDRERLFQAGLTVAAPDGAAPIFLGHNDPEVPEVRRDRDPELRLLALQHRAARLYATGRQCAVDAEVADGQARAWRLRTTCFPAAEVAMVSAGDPADMPGVVLDMARLGSPDLQPDDLVRGLRPLVEGYRRWLERNLECGLLIRGGPIPALLAGHLHGAEGLEELACREPGA